MHITKIMIIPAHNPKKSILSCRIDYRLLYQNPVIMIPWEHMRVKTGTVQKKRKRFSTF